MLSPLSKGKSSNVPNESKVLLPAKQKITGDAYNVIDDIRINLKLLWMGQTHLVEQIVTVISNILRVGQGRKTSAPPPNISSLIMGRLLCDSSRVFYDHELHNRFVQTAVAPCWVVTSIGQRTVLNNYIPILPLFEQF